MNFFRQKLLLGVAFGASLGPFLVALFMQHGLGMEPCVLCIYQRVALLGIALTTFVALMFPKCPFFLVTVSSVWLYSSGKGLESAWEQLQRYQFPERFAACPFRPNFPSWLPLDEWLPAIFSPYAGCEKLEWSFLGLNMPQWMILLFSAHMLLALLVISSQILEWRRHAKHFCPIRWKKG